MRVKVGQAPECTGSTKGPALSRSPRAKSSLFLIVYCSSAHAERGLLHLGTHQASLSHPTAVSQMGDQPVFCLFKFLFLYIFFVLKRKA